MFIESIAKELYPKIANKQLSTACLCTSNPVYLIFTEEKSYPEIVIRVSESDNISRPHKILQELFKHTGDLIPEPLIQTSHGSRFISVQKGVDGIPWFQLAGSISSKQQWDRLRTQAVETLNTLHQGIQSCSQWNRTCHPGTELRQRYQECIGQNLLLPDNTETLLTKLAGELDHLGTIAVFPQHGDFCLNNLIIDGQKMHIIDFEDFEMTCMPLHDQFTLALSTYQLAPAIARSSLADNIDLCVGDSLQQMKIDRRYLAGFFMHHLLLRLGEWSQNRRPYRQWLLSILEKFINNEINLSVK